MELHSRLPMRSEQSQWQPDPAKLHLSKTPRHSAAPVQTIRISWIWSVTEARLTASKVLHPRPHQAIQTLSCAWPAVAATRKTTSPTSLQVRLIRETQIFCRGLAR